MKNIWIYIRWFLVSIPVGFFGILTSWFFVPYAWFTRKWKISPFWLWEDDSRKTESGYSVDYRIELENRDLSEENFKVFYYWHVKRNRVYNIIHLFGIPNTNFEDYGNNNIKVITFKEDNLKKYNGTKVYQDKKWVAMAGLKYVPKYPGQDPWQVNKGDILNSQTSILGKGHIIYKVGNWKSFRFSSCKIVDYKIFGLRIWKGYRTIKTGTNSARYVFSIKHQAIKPWK